MCALTVAAAPIDTNISIEIYAPAATRPCVSILILLPFLNCHICYKGTCLQYIKKNSERSAFIRFKGINVQSGNSEACHVQLLLVSHSPGLRPAHLHELKPETHL